MLRRHDYDDDLHVNSDDDDDYGHDDDDLMMMMMMNQGTFALYCDHRKYALWP